MQSNLNNYQEVAMQSENYDYLSPSILLIIVSNIAPRFILKSTGLNFSSLLSRDRSSSLMTFTKNGFPVKQRH